MVSELLLAALLLLPEPLLELDCEPAVQPAAIMPAATMTPYLVRVSCRSSLLPYGPLGPEGPDQARSLWLRAEPAAALPASPAPDRCLRAGQPPRLSNICIRRGLPLPRILLGQYPN